MNSRQKTVEAAVWLTLLASVGCTVTQQDARAVAPPKWWEAGVAVDLCNRGLGLYNNTSVRSYRLLGGRQVSAPESFLSEMLAGGWDAMPTDRSLAKASISAAADILTFTVADGVGTMTDAKKFDVVCSSMGEAVVVIPADTQGEGISGSQVTSVTLRLKANGALLAHRITQSRGRAFSVFPSSLRLEEWAEFSASSQ